MSPSAGHLTILPSVKKTHWWRHCPFPGADSLVAYLQSMMPSRTLFWLGHREVDCKDVSFTSFQPSVMIYFLSVNSCKVLSVTLSPSGKNKAETRPASTYILNSVLFTEYFEEPRFLQMHWNYRQDASFVYTFWRTGSCLIRVIMYYWM